MSREDSTVGRIRRRKVLGTAGALGAGLSVISPVSAQSDSNPKSVGKTMLARAVPYINIQGPVSYNSHIDQISFVHIDEEAKTAIMPDVANKDIEELASEPGILLADDITSIPRTTDYRSSKFVTSELTNYLKPQRTIELVNRVEIPAWSVGRKGGKSARIDINGESVTIPPNSEKQMAADQIELRLPPEYREDSEDDGWREGIPTVRLRNYGILDIKVSRGE